MPQIIQLDVSKLDAEIAGLEAQLAKKRAEREAINSLEQQYGVQVTPELNPKTWSFGPDIHHEDSIIFRKYKPDEYILDYLNGAGFKRVDLLAEAYAKSRNIPKDVAKNHISKAIDFLKGLGKLASQYDNKLNRTVVALAA